jgi:hypothetical protein
MMTPRCYVVTETNGLYIFAEVIPKMDIQVTKGAFNLKQKICEWQLLEQKI